MSRRGPSRSAAACALAAALLVSGCRCHGSPGDGPVARHRLEEGQRLAYRVAYRSEGEAELGSLLGQATGQEETQSYRASAQGTLLRTAVERRDGEWLVAMQVDGAAATFASGGVEDPDQASAIGRGLSAGLFARIAEDGRVVGLRFPSGSSLLAERVAQSLLAVAQVVLPGGAQATGRPWEADEEDAAGRCRVRYAPAAGAPANAGEQPPPEVVTLTRTRLACQPAPRERRPGLAAPRQELAPSGTLTLRFDVREGRLVSIDGEERRDTLVGGRKVATARTSVHLVLLRAEVISDAERLALRDRYAALARGGVDAALSTDLSLEEARRNIDRSVLGDATVEALLAELRQREKRGERNDGLVRKLEALFRLEPEACRTCEAFLRERPSDAPAFQMAWSALALAGGPEAQEAMVRILRARQPDPGAFAPLLNAVAFVARPSPPLVAAVRDAALGSGAADPTAPSALLVLGALARNLGPDRPAEAREIVTALAGELSRTTSAARQQRLLLALGNASSADALPALRGFLGNPSSELRAAATNALRFVEGDEAEGLLVRALSSDPDTDVRLKAAAALGFREPTRAATDAMIAAIGKESAPGVRLELLRDLSQAARSFPDALAPVRKVADADPTPELRQAARGVLQLLGEPGR